MSVLMNKDKTDLIIDCDCKCENAFHIRVDTEDISDKKYYFWASYMNSNFYRDQNETVFRVFCKKVKKIWAIIRNKDYYYSDVMMTEDDWEVFKEFVNNVK